MNPHPTKICDTFKEQNVRCPECMEPQDEIDFWEECYNGKHNNPADCPTWYDWCNCGGTMFEENERLYKQNKEMKELLKMFIHKSENLKSPTTMNQNE